MFTSHIQFYLEHEIEQNVSRYRGPDTTCFVYNDDYRYSYRTCMVTGGNRMRVTAVTHIQYGVGLKLRDFVDVSLHV